ncbi:hypothetical protein DER45DRAFT_555747 [Fusarium avenaceum]|nr:hypothetical protein DER45DRAFT_555747 [Fusarium avenaceum]
MSWQPPRSYIVISRLSINWVRSSLPFLIVVMIRIICLPAPRASVTTASSRCHARIHMHLRCIKRGPWASPPMASLDSRSLLWYLLQYPQSQWQPCKSCYGGASFAPRMQLQPHTSY